MTTGGQIPLKDTSTDTKTDTRLQLWQA